MKLEEYTQRKYYFFHPTLGIEHKALTDEVSTLTTELHPTLSMTFVPLNTFRGNFGVHLGRKQVLRNYQQLGIRFRYCVCIY